MPGISRDAIDRAAMDGLNVTEIPGAHARPPVLVPREDMALALRLHHMSYWKHAAPLFASGRLSETGLKEISSQACRALDEGPLSTSDLRASVTHPDAEELLTGALIDLAARGVIRRFPIDGRLDSSKYMYELRHPDDRPDLDAEGDDADLARKATRVFLLRHGPATLDEVASWSGLTKGAIRKAVQMLGAEQISLNGWSDAAWLLREDGRAWNTFKSEDDHVALLPYRDPFVSVRRPPAVLVSSSLVPVLSATLRPVRINHVDRLNHHAIVAGGELVGVWEYDPETAALLTLVWSSDKKLRSHVARAAAETERFIREQLGDAQLSAVDPPARRAKRVAFCGRRAARASR